MYSKNQFLVQLYQDYTFSNFWLHALMNCQFHVFEKNANIQGMRVLQWTDYHLFIIASVCEFGHTWVEKWKCDSILFCFGF